MEAKYLKWFIEVQRPLLIRTYKKGNYSKKREIKNYIYNDEHLTNNEKDRIWREIVRSCSDG